MAITTETDAFARATGETQILPAQPADIALYYGRGFPDPNNPSDERRYVFITRNNDRVGFTREEVVRLYWAAKTGPKIEPVTLPHPTDQSRRGGQKMVTIDNQNVRLRAEMAMIEAWKDSGMDYWIGKSWPETINHIAAKGFTAPVYQLRRAIGE